MASPYQPIEAPTIIGSKSSNHDTRLYIANLLPFIDCSITNEKAWEMASKFDGDGGDALKIKGEGWEKLFGEVHGRLVYRRFFSFRIRYVDGDTIWPHLRHVYRIFALLLIIYTGGTIYDKEAFAIDSGWNIAAFVYFICSGFAYIFTSAKSVNDNPVWPEYLKIRPMGPKQKSWLSTLGCGG